MSNRIAACLRLPLASCLTALLVLLCALCVLPAYAAGAVAQVSYDRVNFSEQLPHAPLSEINDIVPGDQQTEVVWVKNTSARPVHISVRLRWTGPQNTTAFDHILSLGIADQSATVAQLRAAPLIEKLGEVHPGEVKRVELTATLPLSATNPTQRQHLGVALTLLLSGPDDPQPTVSTTAPTTKPTGPSASVTAPPSVTATPSGGPGDDGDEHDSGRRSLPYTGTDVAVLLLLAAGLVVAGYLVVYLTKRQRRSKHKRQRQRQSKHKR